MEIVSFPYFFLGFIALLVVTIFNNKNEIKKSLLLVLSYYFYMTIDWQFAGVLLFLCTVNYFAGNYIVNSRNDLKRKIVLSIAIVLSLSVLFYFKYLGFFIESFYQLVSLFGIESKSPFIDIILPIGISFMTFQAITYPLDLYSGKLEKPSSFKDYSLFMAFFPQILSGPIVRASFFMPQLSKNMRASGRDMMEGFTLILRGLIKKIVFADILAAQIVDPAFAEPGAFSSVFLVVALVAYSFQVYMDLSGYTDMAIGVGKVLGYNLPVNFNRPYLATSVANFWQRWHITMSSFFRDYLYEGISRFKWSNIYLNLWMVFIAIGIWHGAGWNFVLYGFIHGSLVGYEHFIKELRANKGLPPKVYRGTQLAIRVMQIFIIIVLTRLLFRGDDLHACFAFISAIFTSNVNSTPLSILSLLSLGGAALLHFTPVSWRDSLMNRMIKLPPIIYGGLTAFIIYSLIVFSLDSAGFIYFQF